MKTGRVYKHIPSGVFCTLKIIRGLKYLRGRINFGAINSLDGFTTRNGREINIADIGQLETIYKNGLLFRRSKNNPRIYNCTIYLDSRAFTEKDWKPGETNK